MVDEAEESSNVCILIGCGRMPRSCDQFMYTLFLHAENQCRDDEGVKACIRLEISLADLGSEKRKNVCRRYFRLVAQWLFGSSFLTVGNTVTGVLDTHDQHQSFGWQRHWCKCRNVTVHVTNL